jgi:hypothetical protein
MGFDWKFRRGESLTFTGKNGILINSAKARKSKEKGGNVMDGGSSSGTSAGRSSAAEPAGERRFRCI